MENNDAYAYAAVDIRGLAHIAPIPTNAPIVSRRLAKWLLLRPWKSARLTRHWL